MLPGSQTGVAMSYSCSGLPFGALSRRVSLRWALVISLLPLALSGCLTDEVTDDQVTGADTGDLSDDAGKIGDVAADSGSSDVSDGVTGDAGCENDLQCITALGVAKGSCKTAICKSDGTCAAINVNPDQKCDDGDACTTDDKCDGKGTCTPGAKLDATKPTSDGGCDDGDVCTQDSCVSHAGCQHDPNPQVGKPCDDGDKCTGTPEKPDTCGKSGTCQSGPATDCDDGNSCTTDGCSGKSGCTHLPKAGNCDDGNKCTKNNACAKGKCDEGLPVKCTDDKNPCTLDVCDNSGKFGAKGCVHPPAPATATCDDGNKCTDDSCDGKGKCVGKPAKTKDGKANLCACESTKDCAKLEDGKVCNGTLKCTNVGVADLPQVCTVDVATVVVCKKPAGKDGGCLLSTCSEVTKKCETVADNKGGVCDDGNKCTAGDKCNDVGICVAGKGIDVSKVIKDGGCDDGNGCTADSCDAKKGCVHDGAKMAAKGCDDGDKCTTGDLCAVTGACQPGKLKSCDDGDVCTLGEACEKATGACSKGKAKVCDDGDACTTDSCDAKKGCVTSKVSCDDGNPCTIDSCDPKAKNGANGCLATKLKDGVACASGGAKGVCKGGVCDAAADFDHDGLTGAADKCPTVWNPDGDAKRGATSCPEWKGSGWGSSSSLSLTEPGQQAGLSKARRTNEPVEIPLVNGIRDASLVGYWPLDDDATGAFGDAKGAKTVGAATKHTIKHKSAFATATGTLMTWVRLSKMPANWAGIFEVEGTIGAGNGDLQLMVLSSGAVQVEYEPNTAFKSAPVKWMNAWRHVAVTWGGSAVGIYVDGRLVASQANAKLAALAAADLKIGWGEDAKNKTVFPLLGDVDDAALFNRALSPAEIATYAASKAPYGGSFVPGAQADFDDVRVTEKTNVQVGEHATHFEVIGARPHSDTDLKDVVAYWKLDGDAKDVTGKHDGKLTSTALATGRFGDSGGATRFDGKGAHIAVDHAAALTPKNGTVELWVRPDDVSKHAGLVTKMSSHKDPTTMSWYLALRPGGTIGAYLSNGQKSVFVECSTRKLHVGAWHHVASTWDAKNLTVYVDGVRCVSTPSNGYGSGGGHKVYLGSYRRDGSKHDDLSGLLDEVIVHSVARSADYFAKRARGLPRVRFLAHTRAKAEATGGFKSHDYTLRWGNKAAKAVPTQVVGLDKKMTCDALLSPCLGYAGWWRFDDPGALLFGATSARSTLVHYKGPQSFAAGGHAGGGLDTGKGAVKTASPFQVAPGFTIETSARYRSGSHLVHVAGSPQHFQVDVDTNNGNKIIAVPHAAANKCGFTSKTALPKFDAAQPWAHLAFAYAGAIGELSVNGVVESTSNCGLLKSIAVPVTLGGDSGMSNPADVVVDDFRLMHRALSADELSHFPLLRHGLKATAPPKHGCDDGNACTIDTKTPAGCLNKAATSVACSLGGTTGTCRQGVCKDKATCVLGYASYTKPNGGLFDGVDVAANGDVFVAPQYGTSESAVMRIGADKKALWTTKIAATSSLPAIEAAANGDVVAGGYGGRLARVGASGKLLWTRKVGELDEWVWDIEELSDGKLAIVGARKAGKFDGVIGVFTASGQPTWTENVGTGGAYDQLYNVAVGPDRIYAVGRSVNSTIALAYTHAGKKLWHKTLTLASKGRNDLAVLANGQIVVTGDTTFAVLNRDGAAIWTKDPAHGELRAVSVFGDANRFVVMGKSGFSGWEAIGKKWWNNGVPKPPSYGWFRVRQAPAGDLVFVGGGVPSGTTLSDRSGTLMRMSPYGYSDCAKAGLCAGGRDRCDDDNACTTDWCEPSKGCTHAVIKTCGAPPGWDQDNDGLADANDKCPNAWSPDDDGVRGSSSCAPFSGKGWSWSSSAGLRQPGLNVPWSAVRRTNEPVELPLVNGILDASVAGYWKFDGDGKDSSDGALHLSNGSAKYTADTPFDTGKSFDAGATGDSMRRSLKAPISVAEATVSLWVKPLAKPPVGGGCYLFSSHQHSKTQGKSSHWHAVWTNGKGIEKGGLMLGAGQNNFAERYARTAAPVMDNALGRWTHVAATFRDGNTDPWRVYVDGKPVAHVASGQSGQFQPMQLQYFAVGRAAAVDPNPACKALFDDVVIFRRALSPDEIATYVASKTPYGSGFVPNAQADFDDVRVTEATDSQPWDHHTHAEIIGARPHSDTSLQGVVGYWKLDGDAKDVVGKHNGTVKSAQATVGRFGDADGAMALGSGKRVETGYAWSVNGSSSYTIEAWVRRDAGSTKTSFVLGAETVGSEEFTLYASKSGLAFSVAAPKGKGVFLQSDAFANGRWSHVAVVRDGATKTATLYIDGVAQKTAADTTQGFNATNKRPLWIGANNRSDGQATQFEGAIDEVIIHDVARSADYIAKRAIGLPRVRFLAHTRSYKSSGGAYRYHDYKLWWGNKAAKALATKVIGLDKNTACDALLGSCLGYVAWWRMDRTVSNAQIDESATQLTAWPGGKPPLVVSGLAGQAIDGKGAWWLTKSPHHPVLQKFSLEVATRLQSGAGIAVYSAGDGNEVLSVRNASGKGTRMGFKQDDGAWCMPSKEPTITKGIWRPTALTYDGKTATWFDPRAPGGGATQNKACKTPLGKPVPVGLNHSSKPLDGELDEVRLMNRALRADELLRYPLTTHGLGGK